MPDLQFRFNFHTGSVYGVIDKDSYRAKDMLLSGTSPAADHMLANWKSEARRGFEAFLDDLTPFVEAYLRREQPR